MVTSGAWLAESAVTDFMHFRFFEFSFFVNNLADDFIFIGFVFLITKDIKMYFNKIFSKK